MLASSSAHGGFPLQGTCFCRFTCGKGGGNDERTPILSMILHINDRSDSIDRSRGVDKEKRQRQRMAAVSSASLVET